MKDAENPKPTEIDERLLEATVEEHRERIVAWLRSRYDAHQQDAEDAVAVAVRRIWQGRNSLRSCEPTGWRRWLYKAADLEYRGTYRLRKRLKSVAIDAITEAIPSNEPTLYEQLEVELESARRIRLSEAAKNRIRLPGRKLISRWQNGESPQEIANELGVPAARIRKQIQRLFEKAARIARELDQHPEFTRFTLPLARQMRIAEISGTNLETVRSFLLNPDWANADEHQDWLDSAGDAEIADWLVERVNEFDVDGGLD
jgi:RNA polymerase sigma factor (sigma-70 family)